MAGLIVDSETGAFFMMRSMTAFARREASTETGTLSWEIRSLNHRYLEPGLRLPEELRAVEAAVRERLGKRLARGKVECTCRYRPQATGTTPVDIDTDNLARLLAACEQVAAELPSAVPLNPLDILRWPGVLQEKVIDTEPLVRSALELLDRTLDDLVTSREREGEQIAALLSQRCDAMSELVQQARKLLPDIRATLRTRLESRLAELDIPADRGRLEQELVLQLQKVDVDEEMDRLQNHIEEVRRVLTRREPVGRRLDFLMQELNREANTLGSKSVSSETTGISVELKVLIEQMREQVQNVE
ncbi:MAG TPA: YicC/YloC family endoribonuclease [Gammaproteobacteria bacterium]|nr:YicC/YloC family endoribonuclease [Gammaproteobacteria bacterium]